MCHSLGLLAVWNTNTWCMDLWRVTGHGISQKDASIPYAELMPAIPPANKVFAPYGDPFGAIAFTQPSDVEERPQLLMAEVGSGSVHVTDIIARRHLGYIKKSGAFVILGRVASHGDLVAVSVNDFGTLTGTVCVFRRAGKGWEPYRTMCQRGSRLLGMRFVNDGKTLLVTDNHRGVIWAQDPTVDTDEFTEYACRDLVQPLDVEDHGNGLAVFCVNSRVVTFPGHAHHLSTSLELDPAPLGGFTGMDVWNTCPVAMAYVQGLGVLVRESNSYLHCAWPGAIHVLATPDVLAMAAMSETRVAWLHAVARGIALRTSWCSLLQELLASGRKRRSRRGRTGH